MDLSAGPSNIEDSGRLKRKKKTRKFTFFRGVQFFECPKLKNESAIEFKNAVKDLIDTHPNLVIHPKRQSKTKGSERPKRFKKDKNQLKQELLFGLRSVLRKVQNGGLFGVMLNADVTTHLQQTMFELCEASNTPFVLVPSLSDLSDVLKISLVTCIGFLQRSAEPTALSYKLFSLFKSYTFNQNPRTIEARLDKGAMSSISSSGQDKQRDVESTKTSPEARFVHASSKRFEFEMPGEEEMYIAAIKCDIARTPDLDPFSSQSSFVKLAEDPYFPPIDQEPRNKLRISYVEADADNTTFGKSLIGLEQSGTEGFPEPATVSIVAEPKSSKPKKVFLTKNVDKPARQRPERLARSVKKS